MSINNNEVGERIKKLRSEKGLSQEEFGKLIKNAHKSLVSKWEKGQSLPNNERLKIIAELGGISVNELLYGHPFIEEIKEKNLYEYLHDYVSNYFEMNKESLSEKYNFSQERILSIKNRAIETIDEETKNVTFNSIDAYYKDRLDDFSRHPYFTKRNINRDVLMNNITNIIEVENISESPNQQLFYSFNTNLFTTESELKNLLNYFNKNDIEYNFEAAEHFTKIVENAKEETSKYFDDLVN